jgi:hypothetical protein
MKKSERGVQPDEEANESLSDKGDGEATLGTGDVDMDSQDVKMEVGEASIKEESADIPERDSIEEPAKPDDTSLTESVEVPQTNAMEVDH